MSKFLRILRRVFLFFIGFVVFLVILSKVLEAYEERHLYDRVLIDMASTTNLSSHNRTGNIDIAIAKRLNKTRKSSNPNLSETLKAELKFPIIKLSTCPQPSPFLEGWSNVSAELTLPSWKELEETLAPSLQQPGGRYRPKNCTSHYKIAIIVPYRDREKHLRIFLQHMHPFLQRQQIEYGIFVVEQTSNDVPFNKGRVMNAGIVEILLLDPTYKCFLFHDVDLIPEDDWNLYGCPKQPRHLSVAVSSLNYTLPYSFIFGGVVAMQKKHFDKVNGFSNRYWGWGAEDDDMYFRIEHFGLTPISRPPPFVALYTMLSHKQGDRNPVRHDILYSGPKTYNEDGLNSLEYKLVDIKLRSLYIHIMVDVGKP